ncbi:MAG: diacylglycerol kinase family protein [Clostridia bacterium]|nr:diacylglycerol kinase family protein [Clostridia bacterium]
MKHYILYNPLSGKGNGAQEAELLQLLYPGETCENYDMTAIDDYSAFFTDVTADDNVIICGGDGTLNRFINDTADISLPCDVLYHAIGSGNDFLRDVGQTTESAPFSIKQYLENLPMVEVKGKTYRFLNNVGFGIDGYCCEVGDEQKKRSTKPVNYTAIAIKGLLFHFKPTGATVTVDGVTHRYEKVWLAPTMKGRFYGGGMMPTPVQDRNATDRSLSLMVLHGSGKLKTLVVFPSIFKGEHVKHNEMVAIHRGHDICVRFDRPTALQIDGETILNVSEYRATAKVSDPLKATV